MLKVYYVEITSHVKLDHKIRGSPWAGGYKNKCHSLNKRAAKTRCGKGELEENNSKYDYDS